MSTFTCVIQAESAAHRHVSDLEQRLAAHHENHYPGETVSVSWRPIRPGYMYTEGRQSTSSVISCSIRHSTTRASREAYMRGVCDLWTDITGCTDHEIVVSINETEPDDED
ncbi:MAG: hypothetical protein AAF480_07400 [Actinomycetota bacterium]